MLIKILKSKHTRRCWGCESAVSDRKRAVTLTSPFIYPWAVTLQGLFGSVQLLLLLGQLHAELSGREHVRRAASLGLLQVFTQHVLHLPQQAHLLLELGHLLTQQDCNETKRTLSKTRFTTDVSGYGTRARSSGQKAKSKHIIIISSQIYWTMKEESSQALSVTWLPAVPDFPLQTLNICFPEGLLTA